MRNLYFRVSIGLFLLSPPFLVSVALAQDIPQPTVTTAVPFLRITPDSRGAGMGDAGTASPADIHSSYFNPAKLVFAPGGKGVSLSYSPWLPKMAANMWISQLTGFFTLPDNRQSMGASLVYFNQGTIHLKDDNGRSAGTFTPREFALTTTYSRKLSEQFAMAASLRYIYSNLFGSVATGLTGETGHALAGDVGAFFQTDPEEYRNSPVNLTFGASLTNLGTKITYGTQKYFLPTTLRVGTGFTYRFSNQGRFTWVVDAAKLMVPSPPVYTLGPDSTWVVVRGKQPNRDYFSSVFGSFADAPSGFKGELREFILATGLELWANQYLAVRGGYFREAQEQGARQYFTMGLGIRYQQLGLDVAYLVPQRQNHPLAETVRFTLTLTPAAQEQRNALVYSRPNGPRVNGRYLGPYRSGRQHQTKLYRKKSSSLSIRELQRKQKQRERRTRQTLRKYRRERW